MLRKQVRAKRQQFSQFTLSQRIYKQKSCERCFGKHNEANMILCDRCQDAYHTKCIDLPSVPKDTWICDACKQDQANLKQYQIMRKRPASSNSIEQCRGCNSRVEEKLIFQVGETKVTLEARDVYMVKCSYCEQKYHSVCFSERQNAINCRACEESLRDCIPKGHIQFLSYMKQCRQSIAEKRYLQLAEDFQCAQFAYHALPIMHLIPPTIVPDWQTLVSYEASLCYALFTRSMIYCENLVVQMGPKKIQTIMEGHKVSVQKIYRLHKSDEHAYEQFKQGIQKGHLPPLEVRQDRKKGFYIISTRRIPLNTILAEYAGELITSRQSLNLVHNENIFTLLRNPRSVESLDIAPCQFANIAIFISGINNSQKDAKAKENVKAVKFSYKGVCRVLFIATRDIVPRETLFLNYNGDKAISQYPTNDFVH